MKCVIISRCGLDDFLPFVSKQQKIAFSTDQLTFQKQISQSPNHVGTNLKPEFLIKSGYYMASSLYYTANVNRQTADKLLFSYAIITGENV